MPVLIPNLHCRLGQIWVLRQRKPVTMLWLSNCWNRRCGKSPTAYGDKHPRTLETQTELALLYMSLDRYDDAQKLLQDAIAAYRETLGAEHVDTLDCETYLVQLWSFASMYDEAIKLGRDLRKRTLQVLGPDHLVTLQAQHVIGQVLWFTEQYAESQELYDDLIPRGARLLGESHPSVLAARSDRALLESIRGNPLQALQQLQELTEIEKTVYGADHREVLVVQYVATDPRIAGC